MEVLEAEEEGIVVVARSIHWLIFKAPTKTYSFWDQGDQKIWKKLPNFPKSSPNSLEAEKKAKISMTSLYLKAQNIYIKPLLKQ